MVTLIADNLGDSGYEKFILVLETNCMHKQPGPKSYTLQMTTLRTSVRESTTIQDDVTLSQKFSGYYICGCYCMLVYTSECDPSSVVANCKITVVVI